MTESSRDAEHEAPPEGSSLERLTSALARLSSPRRPAADDVPQGDADASEEDAPSKSETGSRRATPIGVVEALLFVGSADGRPLSVDSIASLMRGLDADEVRELLAELGRRYDEEHRPYRVLHVGEGYRLALHPEYARLGAKLHGAVSEAKLSAAAVETLAAVAYHDEPSQREVSRLRDKPSAGVLRQLVRRRLLKVVDQSDPRNPRYGVTDRFLELFRLRSLDDLPRTREIDRM